MDNIEKFWNKISGKYDKQIYEKNIDGYKKATDRTKKYIKETDRILDFACGTGEVAIELSKSANYIYGIDISENMIGISNSKIIDKNITNIKFENKSIFDESINTNQFDVLVAYNVLYLIKDIDITIERIKKLIKPGGIFISTTNCFGEKKNINVHLQIFLSKIGILPYISKLKTKELESIIKKSNFTILETCKLHKNPTNYFIVAQRKG
ncbi:class I SAM-dependent methyltransferase [Clostridiaceae bacterium M8S5]|nr:class I SAM-dependent methyltransferase [Clostridiaceae bacterium M8S5]